VAEEVLVAQVPELEASDELERVVAMARVASAAEPVAATSLHSVPLPAAVGSPVPWPDELRAPELRIEEC